MVDGTELAEGEGITVVNEKPQLKKEIVSDLKNSSVVVGQEINYKITISSIPEMIEYVNTLTLKDILPVGLEYVSSSLEVTGIERENAISTYSGPGMGTLYLENYNSTNKTLTVDFFDMWEVDKYSEIIITYTAKVTEDAPTDSNGMKNMATLQYSLAVMSDYDNVANIETTETITDDITVYTGGFWVEKRALTEDGDLLPGAVFRIATTEENAKNEIYLEDINGNVIELISDTNGRASYKGIELGTYWLVEVKAPTYEENGKIKSYNLLRTPQEIIVSNTSYESDTPAKIIINKKGFELPATGSTGAIISIFLGIILVIISIATKEKRTKKRAKRR